MKLVCIFWLCLTIHSNYGQIFGSSEEMIDDSESIFSSWSDFQIRHIVSTNQGSAANWNQYFRQRMPQQYGTKSVNTFIVSLAHEISINFPEGVPQYTGGSASNLYWSSTSQHIFVLTLSGTPQHRNYNVYDCGLKYFVAGLDMKTRLPVHYQGHSSTQGPRIDSIISGCSKLTTHNFLSQVNETMNGNQISLTLNLSF